MYRANFFFFFFIRRDQVNLLVDRPHRPFLSKNKKILQNFDQLAFLIYYFLLFEYQTKINSHDPYFIVLFFVIVTNKKTVLKELRVFLLVCYAKYYFLKNTDPKNQILFLFCRPTDPSFFDVLPVYQKINLVSPSCQKTQASRL